MQDVQIADRVQLFFRRMQPRNRTGAFRNLRAVAAQVHRVSQAGLLHSFRNCVALCFRAFGHKGL